MTDEQTTELITNLLKHIDRLIEMGIDVDVLATNLIGLSCFHLYMSRDFAHTLDVATDAYTQGTKVAIEKKMAMEQQTKNAPEESK